MAYITVKPETITVAFSKSLIPFFPDLRPAIYSSVDFVVYINNFGGIVYSNGFMWALRMPDLIDYYISEFVF